MSTHSGNGPKIESHKTEKSMINSKKDTTKALTMSPGWKDAYISTLSISVARTSCCLKPHRHIYTEINKFLKPY